MQGSDRRPPLKGLLVPLHIDGDPAFQRLRSADSIDRLLHRALAAVIPLPGVGRRRQPLVVQDRQHYLQVGRMQLIQGDRPEFGDPGWWRPTGGWPAEPAATPATPR